MLPVKGKTPLEVSPCRLPRNLRDGAWSPFSSQRGRKLNFLLPNIRLLQHKSFGRRQYISIEIQ
jgi:hypothetical protein